jgi:hypothetical protein
MQRLANFGSGFRERPAAKLFKSVPILLSLQGAQPVPAGVKILAKVMSWQMTNKNRRAASRRSLTRVLNFIHGGV